MGKFRETGNDARALGPSLIDAMALRATTDDAKDDTRALGPAGKPEDAQNDAGEFGNTTNDAV